MGTVSRALLDYAAEVRPLVDRLNTLRAEAAAFERRVADDDEWVADGDLIDENTARRNAVNAAWSAFQAAELACHNKIVALVGGEPLVVNDGSSKENMYGYRAEDLDVASGLPWGDAVEESNPWYYFHEHAWDFTAWFFVDGVWGTVRGLGTLVGVDGWDAAGQAWTGLGKLLAGIVITGTPLGAAYWLTPADKLPSWLRDSRTAVVETGKALIAYDEWGKKPVPRGRGRHLQRPDDRLHGRCGRGGGGDRQCGCRREGDLVRGQGGADRRPDDVHHEGCRRDGGEDQRRRGEPAGDHQRDPHQARRWHVPDRRLAERRRRPPGRAHPRELRPHADPRGRGRLPRHHDAGRAQRGRTDGAVALGPLAVACLAYDVGMQVEVESEYLPRHLLERAWVGEFEM
ncbi:Imm49 family immunity protein [Streptomyces sp. TG1A-60]|uniref:Imm49 family immunity protein n=1 Tax=Streptomyces sp. TG1A-60 TaxID=3129111 RepID=UPI0030D34D3D